MPLALAKSCQAQLERKTKTDWQRQRSSNDGDTYRHTTRLTTTAFTTTTNTTTAMTPANVEEHLTVRLIRLLALPSLGGTHEGTHEEQWEQSTSPEAGTSGDVVVLGAAGRQENIVARRVPNPQQKPAALVIHTSCGGSRMCANKFTY